MRIYLACALTHVPRDQFSSHVAFIHEIAQALKGEGHAVKYALVDSDPQLAEKAFEERARLCYLWDRRMVEEADLVIAEASYPSIGLGIEIQIAEQRGIPVLLIFSGEATLRAPEVEYENPDRSKHRLQLGEGYVTLMALGLPTVIRVLRYGDRQEAFNLTLDAVRGIDPSVASNH